MHVGPMNYFSTIIVDIFLATLFVPNLYKTIPPETIEMNMC